MVPYIVAFFGLTVLIVFHEFGHYLAARAAGVRVLEFMLGLPGPKLLAVRIGETLYGATAILFGGYVKLYGDIDTMEGDEPLAEPERAFLEKPLWKRVAVIVAGPAFNLVLAAILLTVMYTIGVPGYPTTTVAKVLPGTAAASAGLRAGDRVVAVDGTRVDDWEGFVQYVRARAGRVVTVTVRRDGATRSFSVRVGRRDGHGFLGLQAKTGVHRLAPLAALREGVVATVHLTVTFVALVGRLLASGSLIEQSAGPVGIVVESARAVRLGYDFYLYLLALLSINVAIVNLLPVPPLDGGRVAMMLVERARGRRIRLETYAVVQLVGLGLFLVLMLFLVQADIARYHLFGVGM